MTDVDVYIDWECGLRQVGQIHRLAARGREAVLFTYADTWLDADDAFAIAPDLPLGRGTFAPPNGQDMFGTIGDSAPDTWGRRLMQRRERRQAKDENRQARTLQEMDYLLGVNDDTRLGAFRFRYPGDDVFQAPDDLGVPGIVKLGDLMHAAQRIENGEETDEDLQLIFAPGSSLGGARPKASVYDQHNVLSIAKFPKDTDDYSMERWETIALDIGEAAGLNVVRCDLNMSSGHPVFVTQRFDRNGERRIPFLSAMALTQNRDGERGSYLDVVDALTEHGAQPETDRIELYRRITLSVLIRNVDDHLRNHGFLRDGGKGWKLSPAYDINPTPSYLKAPILATDIIDGQADCSIDLLHEAAEWFSISLDDAKDIIRSVADVTRTWRDFANKRGAPKREIDIMESAFEHETLEHAF